MAESMSDVDLALRALRLLDLTDLSDTASETATAQLCARALAAPGPVAAICIWPQFVAVAHRTLRESPVRIATVVNFPAGGTNSPPMKKCARVSMELLSSGSRERGRTRVSDRRAAAGLSTRIGANTF